MLSKIKTVSMALAASTLIFSACEKSDAGEGNNEELITTMKLSFTPAGGGQPLVFAFRDTDGPGGQAPTQDLIQLSAGTTYNVSVELLNEIVTPAENITPEIVEEADAHRFYYSPATPGQLTVSNLNNDANGVPVGLTSTWVAGTASTGTIGIVLRHYPGTPPDKQTTDPVNSPKSGTDIDISFNYSIQ